MTLRIGYRGHDMPLPTAWLWPWIQGDHVIILGVVLIIVGVLIGIPVLYTIGIALVVIGLVLALVGGVAHRPLFGRSHWW